MEFTRLKNYMDKIVREYNTPGVDCIVYKDHKMLFRYFTGMSDVENNKEMNGNEMYLIFSMTKMLTCTAALQLYEKGKYEMSDPVSKYMPEFAKMKVNNEELNPKNDAKIATGDVVIETTETNYSGYAKNQIRIIDLFTMGAGLDYALADDAITGALNAGKTTTRELCGAMSDKVLGFEPGTRFRYSLCHDVLGALIEIWSGKKFGEYMKEHIFDPIGMKDTFFGVAEREADLARMAARYTCDESGKRIRLPLECDYILSKDYESGGAGLTSSCSDYAMFLDTLACGGTAGNGNVILKTETVNLMKTNHLKGKQCEDFYEMRPGYGYGLGVRTHLDKSISGSLSPIGEFGWDGAAGAFSMVDTDNKLSLTYFQHMHSWDLRIQSEMRNALYQDIEL